MIDRHDALNRYLDDRATGNRASRERIDPDLVVTIRRFTAIGHLPTPDPDFADRLEDRLMNAGIQSTPIDRLTVPIVADLPSRVLAIDQARKVRGARRWLPMLVSAALVLATLGIAWREFDSGGKDPSSHTGAPAINAPASPTSDATPDDTVLELTLPVDALPIGDGVSAGLGYFSIPPGNSSTWISKCCRGPMIEYIVSGQYTVTVAAAIDVFRADGTVEPIPANTVATLGPGDSLLSRNETEAQAVNNGTEPVEIVQWTFVDDSGDKASFRGHLLSGWIDGGGADVQGPLLTQPLPTTVELRLVDVLDGDSIAPPPDGWLFVVGKDAFATDEHNDDRRVYGPVGQPFRVYFLTVTQSEADNSAVADDATDESLFEITLPGDRMPPGEDSIVLAHNSIPASVTASWAQPTCPGLLMEYVLSGKYTVSAEAPFQVARANGQRVDVPARTEVTLGPGDTLLIPNEIRFDAVNGGTEPVEILDALLCGQASAGAAENIAVGWDGHHSTQEEALPDLSQGATIRLTRRDLVPDERVTAPAGGVTIGVTLDATTQSIYLFRDGSFTAGNLTGAPTTTVYTMTLQPAGGGPATPEL